MGNEIINNTEQPGTVRVGVHGVHHTSDTSLLLCHNGVKLDICILAM